jgi:hypothetical protein
MTGSEERKARAELMARARDVQRRLSGRTQAGRQAHVVIDELIAWMELLEARYELVIRRLCDVQERAGVDRRALH